MKAIIFDFDGVIVDSEPLHHAAFARIARDFDVDLDYDTYVRDYIGFDDRDAIDRIIQIAAREISHEDRAGLLVRKADIFAELAATDAQPLPGAVELVRLAAASLPIAIASGAIRRDIDLILENIANAELPPLFQAIVTADDVEHSKPDPATYALAAQAVGHAPEDCLAIEDTITGLQSARAAGMKTLAVTTSYPADRLTGHADRIVATLADVDMEKLGEWFAR